MAEEPEKLEESLSSLEMSILSLLEEHAPCNIDDILKYNMNMVPRKLVKEALDRLARMEYNLEEIGYVEKNK